MPLLSDAELEKLVDDGRIVGLTLDTTEFFHLGYDFDRKSLQALSQFRTTNIRVVFSQVILNEVRADVRDEIAGKAEKLQAGINQYLKAWRSDRDRQEAMESLGIGRDPSVRAGELVDAFVAQIGATEVPVDNGQTVRELHDLYFAMRPPFSSKPDKKSEFPDAMALLSLERWAKDEGGILLVVSNDGDWASFAQQSEHLVCMTKYGPALSLFNRDDRVFAARVAAHSKAGLATMLDDRVASELERLIEDWEFDAQTPYYFDAETEFSDLLGWRLADDTFDVLASDADSVTLSFTVEAEARFGASFTFSVRDGIDRDYVTIGGARPRTEETFKVDIVATLVREDADNPEVIEIESEASTLHVDFGYVDLDYDQD
jgi:hypothetical protein